METKEKIKLMLEEKSKCEELARCLDIYGGINNCLEKNQSEVLLDFGSSGITDRFKLEIPNCEAEFKIMSIEFLEALRDYYEKKIIFLAEND
jgi:hypothetical protein